MVGNVGCVDAARAISPRRFAVRLGHKVPLPRQGLIRLLGQARVHGRILVAGLADRVRRASPGGLDDRSSTAGGGDALDVSPTNWSEADKVGTIADQAARLPPRQCARSAPGARGPAWPNWSRWHGRGTAGLV